MLGKLVNRSRHTAHADPWDQLSETARLPGSAICRGGGGRDQCLRQGSPEDPARSRIYRMRSEATNGQESSRALDGASQGLKDTWG